jgi:CHAT domain-containing protein/cytochrome c-type biogenesis protein CcmH/NrfG
LARDIDKHLNDAEIEELARACLSDLGDRGMRTDGHLTDSERHAERCPDCSQKVRIQKEMQSIFKGQRAEYPSALSRECPADVDWNAVVSGVLPEKKIKLLLAHAATCTHCGYLLKEAITMMAEEATEEEEALLLELKTNRPPWHAEMAQALRRTAPAPTWNERLKRSVFARPIGLPGAGVIGLIIALVVVTWGAIDIWRRPSAEALIAQAYSERRTLEMRFDGAVYGPVRVERGDGSSNLEKPAVLLRAEARIAKMLGQSPNDGTWIDAKARADLLDCNYDAALQSLVRARELEPKSAAVLTDLATAYFMRGETTGKAMDYGHAIDLLGQVLAASPNDPVALFNRAIADERMVLYDDAAEDWEKFLQVETDPGWIAEGKQRFANLKQKIEQRKGLNGVLLGAPAQVLPVLLTRMKQNGGRAEMRSLDEDYLEFALTDWLHRVGNGASGKEEKDSSAWNALGALSQLLQREHGDRWLADLVGGAHLHAWEVGVHDLSEAANARSEGNTSALLRSAAAARVQFRRAGSKAGLVGADLEYEIGLNRSQQGNQCAATGTEGLELARGAHYSWIETALLLEMSTCLGLQGDLAKASAYAERAVALADKSKYEGLRLDALFYLDGVTAPWVASTDAWDRMRAGLEEFWRTHSSPLYGGYFYSDMVFGAEVEGMWDLAVEAAKEAVLFHEGLKDRVGEAAACHQLAMAAEAAGDMRLADVQYERAGDMLDKSAGSDPAALVTLRIENASLELRQNRIAEAAAKLAKAEKGLAELHSQYAYVPYDEALGELYIRSGLRKPAEQALTKAIAILEGDTASLKSDREKLLWHRENARAYRDLLEIYCRIDRDAARSFAFEEWYRAAPLRAYRRVNPLADSHGASRRGNGHGVGWEFADDAIERVQLKPGAAVLSWISFPSGLAVWLWDGKAAKLAWVDVSEEKFKTTITRFARLCADPESDRSLLERDARQIYSWMVQPFGSELSGIATLIVEPDDFVRPIPFQALQSPDGHYLGERFAVIDSPGLAYARDLRARDTVTSAMTALSIGDPRIETVDGVQLPPLPEADREAQEVGTIFSHHSLLTGQDATLTKVSSLLPTAEILHFAGHSRLSGNQPGLLLAGAGRHGVGIMGASQLQPKELQKLRLVVLSACATGVAPQGMDDPDSLVRVFLRAGVPHVLASSWRVDSQVTTDLMSDFYSGLMRGDSVAEAFASAQKAIRSRPETSHPYYWANFAQFGG